jgi:hypothetical protein
VSLTARATSDGLTLVARGEGARFLPSTSTSRSVRTSPASRFAIDRQKGDERSIYNRLTFADPVIAETSPAERQAISTPTDEAPLQKFHWVHFPQRVPPGKFTYTATAMLFRDGSEDQIEPGPETSIDIDLKEDTHANFELGFTRGYVSSQAYADLFQNAPLYPDPQTFDFPSAEYVDRWRWLGFRARELVYSLLEEAKADAGAKLDVFAFDLDEPDLIRALQGLGPKVRIFLDNSASHVHHAGKTDPPEVGAKDALVHSAGEDNIKVGHFGALAHDKIIILTRGDGTKKVLSGSANFSVRGLYVQSNSVFAFDGGTAADKYAAVFNAVWESPTGFGSSELASQWFDISGDGLPSAAVSFAPHSDSGFRSIGSLRRSTTQTARSCSRSWTSAGPQAPSWRESRRSANATVCTRSGPRRTSPATSRRPPRRTPTHRSSPGATCSPRSRLHLKLR